MNVTEDQAAVTDELWELMKQAVPDGIGPFVDAIVGDEINLHFPHAGLSPDVLRKRFSSPTWKAALGQAGRFGDEFVSGIIGCVYIQAGAPALSIHNPSTEDTPFVVNDHDPTWHSTNE
jgi:hypothetical protein